MEKKDVVNIANQQRHLNLLKKVKQGDGLSPAEIKELAKYEGKNKAKKVVKSKKNKTLTLNPRQEAFCREYIVDRNATQAAIRAGYSAKTAKATGSRMLTYVNIQAKIKELEKPVLKKQEVTAERVVQELARIAFSDVADLFDEDGNMRNIREIPESARRAIAGVDVKEEFETFGGDTKVSTGYTKKIKMADKIKALELLGKTHMLSLFSENINIKEMPAVNIVLNKGKK